jgi:5-formyltetrahydrofolate cyclo-ligase
VTALIRASLAEVALRNQDRRSVRTLFLAPIPGYSLWNILIYFVFNQEADFHPLNRLPIRFRLPVAWNSS